MGNPLVSIIIPVYNYEKYILDCLLSCVHQSYENVEIIAVDDASTDKSYLWMTYAEYIDPRIKVVSHTYNQGYSAAKNTAIRMSTGEFIRPLDADDMITANGITRPLEMIKDLDMVHGTAAKLDGRRFNGGYAYALRLHDKLPVDKKPEIHAQSVMYRRELHEKYGLYCESLRSRADKEMWKRFQHFGVKMKHVDEPWAYYRIHDKSMQAMRNRNPKYNQKMTNILAKRIKEVKETGVNRENTPWLS